MGARQNVSAEPGRRPAAARPHPTGSGRRTPVAGERAPRPALLGLAPPIGGRGAFPAQVSLLQAMQRTLGNRAVGRLLGSGSLGAPRRQRWGGEVRPGGACVAAPPVGEDEAAPGWRPPAGPRSVQRLTAEERAEDLAGPVLAGNGRLERAFDNDPPLKAGEAGEAVRLVQHALVDDGFALPGSTKPGGQLDGVFGPEMARQVRAFQAKQGLESDGVVGRQTLRALDRLAGGGGGRPGGCTCPPGTEPDDVPVGQGAASALAEPAPAAAKAKTCQLCKPKGGGAKPAPPSVTEPTLVPGSVAFSFAHAPLTQVGGSAYLTVFTFRGLIQPVLTCQVRVPGNWQGKLGLVQNSTGISFGALFGGRLWSWVLGAPLLDIDPSADPGPFIHEPQGNGAQMTNSFPVERTWTLTLTFTDRPSVQIPRYPGCNNKPAGGPSIDYMNAFHRFRVGVVAQGLGGQPRQLGASGEYWLMSMYQFAGSGPQPEAELKSPVPSFTEGAAAPPLMLTGTPAVTAAATSHNAEESRLRALPCP